VLFCACDRCLIVALMAENTDAGVALRCTKEHLAPELTPKDCTGLHHLHGRHRGLRSEPL
jgi:hypothetical protein